MTNKQFLEAIYHKIQQLTLNKQATTALARYISPAYNKTSDQHCIQVKWCAPYELQTLQHKQIRNIGFTIYTDILQLDITTINHTRDLALIATYEWTDPQLLEKLETIINTIPNKTTKK